jgi:hypothetical protein
VSCLLKLVLADNLIIIKLISCFVTKTLNLGAYLFVMKKIFSALSFLCYLVCSCQSKLGDPEVDPNEIQKFMDWWSYQYNEIMLSRDFVALDSKEKLVKRLF